MDKTAISDKIVQNAFFGLRGTLGAVEHSYGVIVQKSVRACHYGKINGLPTPAHAAYGLRKRAYTIHAAVNVLQATFS